MSNRKVRCPICGNCTTSARLSQVYPIEVFTVHGLGKAKGFGFEPSIDPSLVSLVKRKILDLYSAFFGKSILIHDVDSLKISDWEVIGRV